jgi:AcrR family transcriptional regulator
MAPTRRERLRAETIAEIKRSALDQIARDGAPSLSIRKVARDIGMSPAGLYRYYDGRDALITDLITDAYTDLAAAVENAIGGEEGSHADRFAAGVRRYRRWALEHPNRFLLIFGTPIPGYAAPEGGPTVEANRRMGQAFFTLAAEAIADGSMAPLTGRGVTPGERAFADEISPILELPAEAIGALLGTWAHWHGLVALEVTHQFDWIYAEDADVFFDAEIDRMIRALGMDDR